MGSLVVLFYFVILFSPLSPKVLKNNGLTVDRVSENPKLLFHWSVLKAWVKLLNTIIFKEARKRNQIHADELWDLLNAWHPLSEMNCEASKRMDNKSCLLWCKTAMWFMSHSLTQPAPFIMMNVSRCQHIKLPWECVFVVFENRWQSHPCPIFVYILFTLFTYL